MKHYPSCGRRLRRQTPDNAEYGVPAVDGRRYPDHCPYCEAAVSHHK
ncbi:MAG: hypothetical protein U9O06_13710 [Euryarchaeota archaeon]|nr:hypothetical protein [Euryarchaeota archaeon]